MEDGVIYVPEADTKNLIIMASVLSADYVFFVVQWEKKASLSMLRTKRSEHFLSKNVCIFAKTIDFFCGYAIIGSKRINRTYSGLSAPSRLSHQRQ